VFDDLLRELKRLERGAKVSVTIPPDDEGYDEKVCPNPECTARFKIHGDDSSKLVVDDILRCPLCRHEADTQSWFTPEQVEYAKRVAFDQIQGRVDQAFRRGAQAANRRAPTGGLISLSFEYKPGRREYLAPLAASEVLEQRSTCEMCGCRYASIGAAFFCPACGHNSARSTFAATIRNVRQGISFIPRLAETLGRDAAADLGRGIAENALVKLVTAFQRFAEATYDALPDPKATPAFNAFQRLDDGHALFDAATGRGFDAILTPDELRELARYFQQRHVLVHDDGIVDQLYVDRSGDTTYQVGQRLVIKPAVVLRAAELIEKLANGL
jgi:hypothetical protein